MYFILKSFTIKIETPWTDKKCLVWEDTKCKVKWMNLHISTCCGRLNFYWNKIQRKYLYYENCPCNYTKGNIWIVLLSGCITLFFVHMNQHNSVLNIMEDKPYSIWVLLISRAWCKTIVTTSFYIRSYNSFAPSPRYVLSIYPFKNNVCCFLSHPPKCCHVWPTMAYIIINYIICILWTIFYTCILVIMILNIKFILEVYFMK